MNRESNPENKTLTTPKVKELQGPKVRLKQLVLQSHQISCDSAARLWRNAVETFCMRDDLYHPCTFAWGQSQTLTTPKLKELQR